MDPHDLVKTLAEACQKTDWQIHAFCLMRNHYHLVVETLHAKLVAGTIRAISGRLNLGKPKGAKSNLHRWMTGPSQAGSQPKIDL